MSSTNPRYARWHSLIAKWQTSQMTVREFCDKHQLSTTSFYHWRKQLNLAVRQPARPDTPEAAPENDSPFQLLQVPGSPETLWEIELSLPGGVTLRMRH